MKRYIINDINAYELDSAKEMRFIKRLVKLNYIIAYDKQIVEHERKILLIPNKLTFLEAYYIIKIIYPYSFIIKNFNEIGLI
ncbi:hypothetical protein [uncultured Clostridium sp.]|uniref:hypothetical protein n=1 Tax=uncultured Clostridium sp. TaxID=59620 RepID=UPI00262B117A|nr:hypothetical protein [uncultured Clostridium sp.]